MRNIIFPGQNIKLYLTCLNICGNDNWFTSQQTQQTRVYLYHQTWSKAAEFHCQHLQTWWCYHGSRVRFWKTFVIENRTWGHLAALIRLFKTVSKISDQMKLLLTPHSKTTHVFFTLIVFINWQLIQKDHLRPKVLHCGKLGNETQVVCPAFTFVIFEIPQGPSGREVVRRNQ